ncbi:MAG: AmmeMemoRadiSam system radical SAM enzyme [bacterium]|nr:AmmeMemoRadiSam system radical SAM enzyme [bacterium]
MTSPDRRRFLAALGRCGLGACGFCALGGLGGGQALAGGGTQKRWKREVDFYDRLEGGAIRCGVCPHHCVLDDGETGLCRARVNVKGVHYSRGYGHPCILRVDPIEKVPLIHFLPGVKSMTVATGGCNLRCRYCQNWQFSQAPPDELKTFDLSPEEAVQAAKEKGVKAIAFNYTEPVVFLEYAKEIARAAQAAEIRVVAATGGFVEPEPLLDFVRYVDAITVGLKGFTEDFYEDVCGVSLKGVLNTIKTIKDRGDCWLELVNLIVPTYNDDLRTIRKMCGWIRRNVGVEVPLHFSRFVPMYRLNNLPRTPVTTLESACTVAKQVGLKYVYTANIAPHDGNNSYCPKCGTALVQRLGLKVLENHLRAGCCPKCKLRIPGIWS